MKAEPLTPETFMFVFQALGEQGQADMEWSEACGPPEDAETFAEEAIFVICNSGMKNSIARKIYDRVMPHVHAGGSARNVFGHPGKANAIDVIWGDRESLYAGYTALTDDYQRLFYLSLLPWIGNITKYHLAKNFGVDVAKPDVHLQRLADHYGETPQGLCERLGRATGIKARTADVLLWRACATGVIDSKTGMINLTKDPIHEG